MRSPQFFGYFVTVLLLASLLVFSLASVSEVTRAQALDDREFEDWYSATMDKIEAATITMASAVEDFDCTTCEAGARRGYEDATNALEELEGFEVSPELQPVKDHLTPALENFKSACHYTELGAMNYDADYIETAAGFVASSSQHFEKVDELGKVPPTPVAALTRLQEDLEGAAQIIGSAQTPGPSPTPTPKSPGYEAIFAVGSVIAAIYFVMRRTS